MSVISQLKRLVSFGLAADSGIERRRKAEKLKSVVDKEGRQFRVLGLKARSSSSSVKEEEKKQEEEEQGFGMPTCCCI